MEFIPYGRQSISDADVAAVEAVLRSDFLTQGPAVPRFEEALCEATGAAHAVAVSSATAALHIACLALDVGPGDLVWTSPVTFVASANCARYCGAEVDFVDIDPRSYNLSADALAAKLEEAAAAGRLPKVIIPVHLSGQSCDMEAIATLARRHGVRVIEDASHSIGASHAGEPVGSCRHSDIAVFSFHPVKIVTTAEGGACTTQDPALAERLGLLRSHGITRDERLMVGESHGPWYYQQVELGFNYRMTDVQAALGTSQMTRLADFVARRHQLADRYDALLEDLPVTRPWRDPRGHSALHLYIVRLQLDRIEPTHRQVFEALRAAGIGVNLHYIPVYLQPDYARLGFRPGHCPEAEAYYREAISLPLYPDLTEAQQDRVVDALRAALRP